jgi:thioredoxin-like negative regulator of GroEL
MTGSSSLSQRIRNGLITLAVIFISVALFVGNSTRNHQVSLAALSSHAIPLEEARSNGRPTLIEFYADWCTTCRKMAPLIASLEKELQGQVNFVMLNVDNSRWLPELNQFHVNGIPHFVFLDHQFHPLGSAIGEQPESVMRANLASLQQGGVLTGLLDNGSQSTFSPSVSPVRQPDPQSHG